MSDTSTAREREKFEHWWQSDGVRTQCDDQKARAWATWLHLLPRLRTAGEPMEVDYANNV